MNLIFKRVEIHNFMSFGDEVFDIESYDGLNLIKGINKDIPSSRNGVGKSVILNSLIYGLYGQLPVPVKACNISNRYIKDKEVRIVVYLSVSDKEYKVVTGQNKRAQSYFQLFEVDKDGNEKDITRSTIAESREYFENEILCCDMSLFLRTVLLTSEQNYNFFKLKAGPKKEFIEKLFNIGVFGEMYDKIHRDVLNQEKDISSFQNRLVVLTNQDEEYKTKIVSWKDENANKIATYKENLKVAIGKYEEKKNSIVEKNETLIQKCKDALEKLNTAIQTNKDAILKYNSDIQHHQQNIRFSEQQISEKTRIIEKHSTIVGKLCDDCKVVYQDHYKIGGYRADIENCKKSIEEENKAISEINLKKSAFTSKNEELGQKSVKIKTRLDEEVEKYNSAQRELRTLENAVNNLNYQIENLEKAKNPYENLLESNRKKIENENLELDKIIETYRYIKYAEGIVSQENLRKFIIKDLLGLINNKIKFYLSKLGTRYDCIFDENLDYKFVTESGPCEYGNFSCGEQYRLSIAVNLAFRDFMAQRSNISSNILIIDEYLDSGLDTMAIQSIVDILKDYVRIYKQNIFIVSHRSEINNEEFNHIIMIEKEHGISHII